MSKYEEVMENHKKGKKYNSHFGVHPKTGKIKFE